MYLVNFQQVSNSADWTDAIELRSEDDGELIDLTDWNVTMQVRYGASANNYVGTFAMPYGVSGTPVLEATTANGLITNPSTGVLTWSFPAASMMQVPAEYYDVGLIITKDAETFQLILGVVPIVNGIVR